MIDVATAHGSEYVLTVTDTRARDDWLAALDASIRHTKVSIDLDADLALLTVQRTRISTFDTCVAGLVLQNEQVATNARLRQATRGAGASSGVAAVSERCPFCVSVFRFVSFLP